MKPKDLKTPFTFEKRHLLLEEGLFYLPEYIENNASFFFPPWSDVRIFGNDAPVVVEFCAGNGHWIEEKSKSEKTKNWVAIEKRFDRVRKIWSKKKNHALDNLFIVCGEGHTFIRQFVVPSSVAEVYINFPDPWPKQRHAKHRIMKEGFLIEIARILRQGGQVHFVTDDDDYLAITRDLFKKNGDYCDEKFMINPVNYGSSYFDDLWREKGRSIYHVQYTRK